MASWVPKHTVTPALELPSWPREPFLAGPDPTG